MADVTVTLQGNNISVDKNKVTVSASKSEKVTWTSTTGDFSIEFKPGSNWPNPNTKQNGNTWVAVSGPFNNPNVTLSYGVTAPNHKPLDPEIEIIP